jgi:protein-S-isoprenylcysteine O-methyltransferase Ste14/peptidoglycan/xylan/chitin deacetylase (PgdA/CDA1 family)
MTRLLVLTCFAFCAILSPHTSAVEELERIPDKLVVLTFDDSVASHYTVVRPLLKRYGFGATFFITEGFSFFTKKKDYMTWEQIAELHRDGFEIGNHTRDHMSVTTENLGRLRAQVEAINAECAAHGIPRPVSFAYPGNLFALEALDPLAEMGFRFARRGGEPEWPYKDGRGVAYEPGRDHPLLIPTAGDARPAWTLEDFKRAVAQAHDGHIAVLQFHGVPEYEHPWVHTPPELFEKYLQHLKGEGCRVIALRDLARYVDPAVVPANPMAIMKERRSREGRLFPLKVRIQPWNLVFLIGFVVYCAIRGVYEKRTRRMEKLVRRGDRLDIGLMVVVFVGNVLLPVLYLATPWLEFADYSLPPFVPRCGVVVMLAALWLFWRAHADLGLNWSVTLEVRNGHELVRHGVYRAVRHPMYASIFLFGLAQGLLLANWLAGWSALATFAPLYLIRTPREEQMMCETFGQEYRDYMSKTGRLFPRMTRRA